jgi:hypothetical protein
LGGLLIEPRSLFKPVGHRSGPTTRQFDRNRRAGSDIDELTFLRSPIA